MTASSGLGQSADSVGIAAKPPKNTVIATVKGGGSQSAIVVSPDSRTVYVANYYSSSVSVLDATNNYVVEGTATVGHYPDCLAISPDGTTLYVTCFSNPGAVYVVDTTQPTYPTKATLNAGFYPYGLAVTPDGKKLYVAGQSAP
jgi:YVTN family beta-propeller protein